jgi:hypothetical protein
MQSPLEEYLNQIAGHLRLLPSGRREEELREIRQHLEALVQAYQELGSSESDAITAALTQFGSSRENARGLEWAWQRERVDVAPTIRKALSQFGALALYHLLASVLLALTGSSEPSLTLVGIGGALSLIAGWHVGLEAPGRGWTRALAAGAPVFMAGQLLILGIFTLAFLPLLVGIPVTPPDNTILQFWLDLFLVGTPLGCLGAVLPGIVAPRRQRLPES